MPGTPPCGIGGSQSSDGQCTGTYGQQSSQAGAHVFDGVTASSVVLALIAAGALLAGVVFTRWVVAKVGTFFGEREAALKRAQAEEDAANLLTDAFNKKFDGDEFDRHFYRGDDAEDDAEVDLEDDSERDDALEYDGERR